MTGSGLGVGYLSRAQKSCDTNCTESVFCATVKNERLLQQRASDLRRQCNPARHQGRAVLVRRLDYSLMEHWRPDPLKQCMMRATSRGGRP